VGLGSARAFVGCAGAWVAGRLADVDRRAVPRRSVSSVGCPRCSAGCPAAHRAASTTRGRAASAASPSRRTTPAAAAGCAASSCARMASRAGSPARSAGGTTPVVGSARGRTACLGSAGRRAGTAPGRARSVVGRACRPGRSISAGGFVGGARRARAATVDSMAV